MLVNIYAKLNTNKSKTQSIMKIVLWIHYNSIFRYVYENFEMPYSTIHLGFRSPWLE